MPPRGAGVGRSGRRAARNMGEDWQQDDRQHHHQILDDKPANGQPAFVAVEQAALFEDAKQHHGAGHGEGETEQDAGAGRPVP